jgi:hypothetical protein
MAYWWVSQEELFAEQRKHHCLWVPKQTDSGASFFHWRNIRNVVPGDVIFSYASRSFTAVSIAKTEPFSSDKPVGTRTKDWGTDGLQVDVAYRDAHPAAPLKDVHALLSRLLPENNSPLKSDGSDREGYLFGLPSSAGRLLLDYFASQIGLVGAEVIAAIVLAAAPNPLQRQALAASRLGQGVFRKAVSKVWQGRCVITGASAPHLVQATHIKPWQDSNSEERLDPHNGLLLSALYSRAFTTGLISFDPEGSLMLSDSIDGWQWDQLGIRRTSWIAGVKPEHEPYLDYHRKEVFVV